MPHSASFPHSSAFPTANRSSGHRRRALVCGLSTRAIALFFNPLCQPSASGFQLADHLEIVGLIEPDRIRVEAFQQRYQRCYPLYHPDEWNRALAETRPDLVIVTVPDFLHEEYILRALEKDLDVISEKPMVISSKQAHRVIEAEKRSRGTIQVAFNYRYHPLHTRLKEFIDSGRLGRIIQIDLNYCLDTLHGASYFYRWNRQRKYSGSLAIHKCCHSFDLIRWITGLDPRMVHALGGLDYYGKDSPHRPGGPLGNKTCPYISKWFKPGERPSDQDHPIYDLQGDLGLPFPLQYPKRLTLYDPEIDIEDNYSALFELEKGARMTFSVNFSSPWEGYRLAIAGLQGRLEVQHYSSPARCNFPAKSSAVFMPLFGEPEPLEWETISGGHGGADAKMLQALFQPTDENSQALASSWDGLVAVAMGEGVWRSAVEKRPISMSELI